MYQLLFLGVISLLGVGNGADLMESITSTTSTYTGSLHNNYKTDDSTAMKKQSTSMYHRPFHQLISLLRLCCSLWLIIEISPQRQNQLLSHKCLQYTVQQQSKDKPYAVNVIDSDHQTPPDLGQCVSACKNISYVSIHKITLIFVLNNHNFIFSVNDSRSAPDHSHENYLYAPKGPFSFTTTSFIAKELSEDYSTVQGLKHHHPTIKRLKFYNTHLFEDQGNCLNAYEWEQRTEMVKNFFWIS